MVYEWLAPNAGDVELHAPALDEIASQLRALGWGVDFAAAQVAVGSASTVRSGELEHYVPGPQGRPLLVPATGALDDLVAVHQAQRNRISVQGVNPYIRPTAFQIARYRRAGEIPERRWIAFSLRTPDDEPFVARWDEAMKVSAWVRHAAGLAAAEEFADARGLVESEDQAWLDAYILGHAEGQNLGRRLSYIPLPTIGHRHSDSGIRRVAIVEPPERSDRDAEGLELLRVKLGAWTLTEVAEGRPMGRLSLAAEDDRVIPRYTGLGRQWRSVTPVILHGHNVGRKGISLRKTEKLLCQAFDAAGVSAGLIAELWFQTAPYWPGAGAAAAMRVPQHLKQWPRLHVAVRFFEPVSGPVAIGLGRHYGIGVFATGRDD